MTQKSIIETLSNRLEYEKMLGLEDIPVNKKKEGSAIPISGTKPESISYLQNLIGDCKRCKLSDHRTKLVFGQGNFDARLMFVGEAPGADEDKQGLAFVGRAGQLLTKIIEAMGLKRDEVYICNIIKCRPPENRNPEPDEIEICIPFLKKQIEIIKPEVIICLGKFAAQTLLNTVTPISKLRGNWAEFCEIPLMPTYHPAFLLRNPHAKKDVWEDVQKVMERLKTKD